MSYLTYNGQKVQYNGKYSTYVGITGLVIWDGFDDQVSFSSVPTVSGNKKIEFYLTIDPNMPEPPGGFPASIVEFSPGSSQDSLMVFVEKSGSNFYIHCHAYSQTSTNNKRTGDISSFVGEEVLVEIEKGTSVVNSISINGQSQSLSNSTGFGLGGTRRRIGPFVFTTDPAGVDTYLLRDIKLYDDPSGTNTLTHHWKGYPAGNTDAAWVDQIGSLDGAVGGNPAITS